MLGMSVTLRKARDPGWDHGEGGIIAPGLLGGGVHQTADRDRAPPFSVRFWPGFPCYLGLHTTNGDQPKYALHSGHISVRYNGRF
jgi:hypothetical protein